MYSQGTFLSVTEDMICIYTCICESPRPNEAKLPGNVFELYILLKRGDIKLPYGERIKFLT